MPKHSELVAHLLDLLAPLGEVSARSMFGGWGFYHDGRMFALMADDIFYVKVDDTSRAEFISQKLVPFSYESKNGRREVMSYYTVPTDAMDSSALLCEWAEKGVVAAARAAGKKRRVTRPSARAYKPRGSSSR